MGSVPWIKSQDLQQLFFFSKKWDNYYYYKYYFKDPLNPSDSLSLNLELPFPSFLVNYGINSRASEMGTTAPPNPAKKDVFKPKTQGMKDQNARNLMDSETQVNSKMPLDS